MHNLPHGFEIYLVDVNTMRKIAQIFVAFSEKLNFKCHFSLRTFFFYMELWGRLDRRVAQKVDQKRACSLVVFRGP